MGLITALIHDTVALSSLTNNTKGLPSKKKCNMEKGKENIYAIIHPRSFPWWEIRKPIDVSWTATSWEFQSSDNSEGKLFMKSPALVPHSWHQRLPLFLSSRASRTQRPGVKKGDIPALKWGECRRYWKPRKGVFLSPAQPWSRRSIAKVEFLLLLLLPGLLDSCPSPLPSLCLCYPLALLVTCVYVNTPAFPVLSMFMLFAPPRTRVYSMLRFWTPARPVLTALYVLPRIPESCHICLCSNPRHCYRSVCYQLPTRVISVFIYTLVLAFVRNLFNVVFAMPTTHYLFVVLTSLSSLLPALYVMSFWANVRCLFFLRFIVCK